jgi:hypothetical protein
MTDKTPIQFADDDRQLLRQIAGLVQDMNFRLVDIDERLVQLELKVEDRLQDTKPIWEAVNNRLGNIETRLDNVEVRLGNIETRLDNVEVRLDRVEVETRERFDRLESRMAAFEAELLRDVRELSSIVRHSQRDTSRWLGEFEDRLDKFESGKQS